MSTTHDGQFIICNGDDCNATARAPVALRPVLVRNPASSTETVAGWLYVNRDGSWRHFCGNCHLKYLRALNDFDKSPGFPGSQSATN